MPSPQEREILDHAVQVRLKRGGTTPEYVNLAIPTEPIRLRFGPMRGTSTPGKGSALLMGSKTLVGSPFEISFQLTKLRFSAQGSPTYFAITHSRYGTVDVMFAAANTDNFNNNTQEGPIDSYQPGTLRFYALGIGSSISAGKGSLNKFVGYGSASKGAALTATFYPV